MWSKENNSRTSAILAPEQLDMLLCPFSGGTLTVDHTVGSIDGPLGVCAVLSSEAGRFPVVAGIPILKLDAFTRGIVALVEEGRSEEAVLRLLVPAPGLSLWQRSVLRLVKSPKISAALLRSFERKSFERRAEPMRCSSTTAATFCEHAEQTLNMEIAHYKRLRFSDPTYLPAWSLAQSVADYVEEHGGRLLDIGCGPGQLSWVLASRLGQDSVVGVDVSFQSLYQAKRFMVPGSLMVCCDVDKGLPFRSQAFAAVFGSDAIHYVSTKYLLVREMRRTLLEPGLIVLPHVHNSLHEHVQAGWPLSPTGYKQLLEGLPFQIINEDEILDAQLDGDPYLGSRNSPLENAPDLCILIGAIPDQIRVRHPREARREANGNWVVNPIYRVEPHGDHVMARLTFPSRQYSIEYARVARYLPEVVSIPQDIYERLPLSEVQDSSARELADQLVLLNVPKYFL